MNPGDAVTRKLVTFGRILREAGLEVGPGRLQDAMRGLALVDLADREQVYHALRCTLVARHDHLDIFDAAFTAYWEREPREPSDTSGDSARVRGGRCRRSRRGGRPQGARRRRRT
jgi:uncharacterized protein with von Willebrand factor type A (vWA) domain